MITITASKIPVSPNNDVVKKIAFHIFRILHGTSLLSNANKILRNHCEKMSNILFALLKTYADYCTTDHVEEKFEELVACCTNLKQVVLVVKDEIPAEHRIHSEEVNFDMGFEERRILAHLKTLSRGNEQSPVCFVLEDIEDDIKPYIISVIKEVLA